MVSFMQTGDRMTTKQKEYIQSLLHKLGWENNPDMAIAWAFEKPEWPTLNKSQAAHFIGFLKNQAYTDRD